MMITANIVTIVCLSLILVEVLGAIIKLVFSSRAERISFIRGFKKGKFAIIYITSFPLYYVAHLYQGDSFLLAFFSTVNEIKGLVVFSYETGSVSQLMNDSYIFSATVYLLFIVATVNAFMFTVSIFNQYLWERLQRFVGDITSKDKLYIFGSNKRSIDIYESDKERYKIIIDDISHKEREDMYLNKVRYASCTDCSKYISKLVKGVLKKGNNGVAVINMESDDKNIAICNSFAEQLSSLKEDEREKLFSHLSVYVYGNPDYESIYEDVIEKGYGCIRYLNKYQMIANDLIDKYPISSFLTEDQIDYSTSLLKNDVDVNVFLLGFGKTNKQIFFSSVANNQLLCGDVNSPELKPVNYHIFDKKNIKECKELSYNYYRYQDEIEGADVSKYLPLPSRPANENYYELDINGTGFYNAIRNTLKTSANALNIAIISVGTDLENIDLAQKLIQKCKEWGNNIKVFAKVSAYDDASLSIGDCIFVGNEKEVIYNIDRITNDKLTNMARMRSEIYDLEYDIKHSDKKVIDSDFIENSKKNSDKNWYTKKSQLERESNIYCCLSLRSKLNLMGLDYCEKGSSKAYVLTKEEYFDHYASSDMPIFEKCDASNLTGKPIVQYTLDFKASRRKNMAILEHHRWNSFMICKGMVPSNIEQILSEKTVDAKGRVKYTNGKNYALRRHGNITTFEGLYEFSKLVAERDGLSQLDTDVIKYDYQILDDAYWLLDSNGYEIIKK